MRIPRITRFLMIISLLGTVAFLGGCDQLEGDDGDVGPAGPAGPAGQDVDPATVDSIQTQIDDLVLANDEAASVTPEQCSICHDGVGEEEHQSIYDNYTDASNLGITIDSVVSVSNGDGTFTSTATLSITKNGAPYTGDAGLAQLDQARVYAAWYNAVTGDYEGDRSATRYSNFVETGVPGTYTATAAAIPFAPEVTNGGQVYAYVADEELDVEQSPGSHVHLYNDVASDAVAWGDGDSADPDAYVSAANVAGCEKCHGTPYMKHGYRAPEVAPLPDFASCKSCHFDDRDGGHEDWQILVTDPPRFAEVHAGDPLTPAEEALYAYKAKLMNDVHMAHAMEFPYPQSMANCATCHEGKLTTMVLTDENYNPETCKSCHPVTEPAGGTDPHRAPSLEALWVAAGVDSFHDIGLVCNTCHFAGNGSGAETFAQKHDGYDDVIYTAGGVRYSDIFVMTIDSASFADNILNITFSATEDPANEVAAVDVTDIVPTIMVGLYGYDTKHLLVGPHERTDGERNMELAIDGSSTNPRVEVVSAANGAWEVNVDLSVWADMIAGDEVDRAEIGVQVDLREVVGERDSRSNGESDDIWYGMNAPSRTFDFATNAFDDAYFADVVDVAGGCNDCHDLLATTFHSPTRGGNIRMCKMCHLTQNRGSHLELQSRSIDSYVHAIHSFQAFDSGDVNFTDPVQAVLYELHVEHTFPNFTIKNCEACHVSGTVTYNVPSQAESLPSVNSGSDTWTTADRSVGDIPQFVTGPASRACGGCHRAEFLNEDNGGDLAAWNQHTKEFGYFIEDADGVFDTVVENIMSLF